MRRYVGIWAADGRSAGGVLLLALSNDLSLRLLKAGRWKTLQRWNYALFALTVVHGIAYQVIEDRKAGYVVL
ncbi:MAG: hypothetical protein H0X65_19215, partial [Gemmatimonadetes bacterium]|nr:hypothetical protein [Gemmatimonadota bacterium]